MISDNRNETPLHYACSRQAPLEIIKLLLEYYPKAMTTHTKTDGRNPLHIAVVNRLSIEGIRAIIDAHPYCVLETDRKGLTPLHVACEGKPFRPPLEVIDLLLERYPEGLGATTENGSIPLHMASRGKYAKKDVVLKLIQEYPEGLERTNIRDAKPYQCSRAKEVREYYQQYEKQVPLNKMCPCWFQHPLDKLHGEEEHKEHQEALLDRDGLMKPSTTDADDPAAAAADGEYVDHAQQIALQKANNNNQQVARNRRLLYIPDDPVPLGESQNINYNSAAAGDNNNNEAVPSPPPPPSSEPPTNVVIADENNMFDDDLTQDTFTVMTASEAPSAGGGAKDVILV
jgi:ankyrin repeat protein